MPMQGGGGGMPPMPSHGGSIELDHRGRNGEIKYHKTGKDSKFEAKAKLRDGKLDNIKLSYEKEL